MRARHLDPGVPGLVAEAAEGEEALGALRTVLGVLQAGAGAARAVHAVRHLLQRQRQLQVLPPLQLLLLQQGPQTLRFCQLSVTVTPAARVPYTQRADQKATQPPRPYRRQSLDQ